MRKIEYLSPTSIGAWFKDPTDFYLRYLSPTPPPREKQTLPMSVGSAFDAYVKSFLHSVLFGPGSDPKFEFVNLFEKQVEPHNRDWARKAGEHVFLNYKRLGSLDILLTLLKKAVGKPRFESEIRGTIWYKDKSIPLQGHPDLFFVTSEDLHVILDWKVNGYCSKSAVTPMQGYVRLRQDGKLPSGHASAVVKEYKGLAINTANGLEKYDEGWARQCAVYSWLCGEEVGAEFVAIIHQICCKPPYYEGGKPVLRVAEHNAFVRREFQEKIFNDAAAIIEACSSDWIFRSMSKELSQEHCKVLDARAATLQEDDWFSRASRK